MRRMNCRGRAAKTVAPDDPTVWVRTPLVYPTLSLNQDRDALRRSLQHRMNRHLSQREVTVYLTVVWKLPETFWPQGLQHRMNRRTVGIMRRSSCVSGSSTAKWRGGLLGNSWKPVTLKTSRLMKFVMQVFRGKELTKIWSLEFMKSRSLEGKEQLGETLKKQ
jgi:hypothetical protein